MSQLKNKRVTRSSINKNDPESDQSPKKQQLHEKCVQKCGGEKKKIQQTSLMEMWLKKQQKQIMEQPKAHLYTIKELLKDVTFQIILQKCPKIKLFCDRLCDHPCSNPKLVHQCMDKYFHGNSNSYWEQKYAPRSIDQLFQSDFGRKIQQWIKDFYYYRKSKENEHEHDSQFSFIDDLSDQYSKSMQVRMQNYGWSCRGLILQGRSGVGKLALLNAIAKSMKFSIFQFSSECDQLQKLKEQMKGSSQSQCVNTIINKKQSQQNNKIRRQNKSIVNFIHPPTIQHFSHEIQSKKPKRIQIFRDYTSYYSNDEKTDKASIEESFVRYLLDSVEKSRVPFVLTSSRFQNSLKQSTLQKINRLDTVQFIQPTTEQLSVFFWIVMQVQTKLSYQSYKKIEKDQLFDQLDSVVSQRFITQEIQKYEYFQSYAFINQLVISANKKIPYICKYLQYLISHNLINKNKIVVAKQKQNNALSQRYKIEICPKNQDKTINKCMLQHQYVDGQNSNSNGIILLKKAKIIQSEVQTEKAYARSLFKYIQKQILNLISSDRLIYDIDWSLIEHRQIQNNPLEQTADIDPSEKSDDSGKNLEKYLIANQMNQKCRTQTYNKADKRSLKEIRLELETAVAQDCKGFRQLRYQINEELTNNCENTFLASNSLLEVPYEIHVKAKKQILNNISNKRVQSGHQPLNLRPKDLYTLPLIFKQKRSHRVLRKCNSEEVRSQNFRKIMNGQQLQYMQKFNYTISPDN